MSIVRSDGEEDMLYETEAQPVLPSSGGDSPSAASGTAAYLPRKSMMAMDRASGAQIGTASAVAFLVLLIGLIIGTFGPSVYDSKTYYAYNCPGHSHQWGTNCTGVQVSTGAPYVQILPRMSLLNQVWILDMFPFKKFPYDRERVDGSVKSLVILEGTNSDHIHREDTKWHKIVKHDVDKIGLHCGRGSDRCDGYTLASVDTIEYNHYRVTLSLTEDSKDRDKVGDVQLKVYFYQTSYSLMQIAVRTTLLACSTVMLGIYLVGLRNVSWRRMTFMQKCFPLLMLAVLLYNNPLYPLEFYLRGWVLQLAGAAFQTFFVCCLLLWWSVSTRRVSGRYRPEHLYLLVFELVAIGLYGVFAFVFEAWVRIATANDPVWEEHSSVWGPLLFYYTTSTLYVALLVYIVIMGAVGLPSLRSPNAVVRRRYAFMGCLTGFVLCCVVLGVLIGAYSPVDTTSLELIYYYTLYNLYLWVLMLGVWPARDRPQQHSESESESSVPTWVSNFGSPKPKEEESSNGSSEEVSEEHIVDRGDEDEASLEQDRKERPDPTLVRKAIVSALDFQEEL